MMPPLMTGYEDHPDVSWTTKQQKANENVWQLQLKTSEPRGLSKKGQFEKYLLIWSDSTAG